MLLAVVVQTNVNTQLAEAYRFTDQSSKVVQLQSLTWRNLNGMKENGFSAGRYLEEVAGTTSSHADPESHTTPEPFTPSSALVMP